eukprot:127646-Rhodomonas_salina.4
MWTELGTCTSAAWDWIWTSSCCSCRLRAGAGSNGMREGQACTVCDNADSRHGRLYICLPRASAVLSLSNCTRCESLEERKR